MKKIIISGILTMALLAGCGNQDTHSHTPGETWDWNGTEHWKTCECGEKVDAAAHAAGEDLICTGCGVELWDLGDGGVDTYSHDEYGNLLRYASFDAEGNILSEYRYEYQYDDAGNILLSKSYADGVLQSEDSYTMGSEGWMVPVKGVMYMDDGSTTINEYDEYGNIILVQSFDTDGNLTFDSRSEYAQDDNGGFYEARATEVYDDGVKIVAEYNSWGDITRRERYNADGTLEGEDVWEYGYDETGNEQWRKEYVDGSLTYEIVSYAEVSGEDYTMRYPDQVIQHHEDGTYTVIHLDENDEIIERHDYDADGNEIEIE